MGLERRTVVDATRPREKTPDSWRNSEGMVKRAGTTGGVFSRDASEALTTRVVSTQIGVRRYLDDRCL